MTWGDKSCVVMVALKNRFRLDKGPDDKSGSTACAKSERPNSSNRLPYFLRAKMYQSYQRVLHA